MSKRDDDDDMAEKVAEVILTAVTIVLRRDWEWSETDAGRFIEAVKVETAALALMLEGALAVEQ